LQLLEDPARVLPMADVVANASEFARRFLRTGQGSAGVSFETPVAMNGGGPERTKNGPERTTPAEQRRSDLLVQMDKLRDDVTPAGEAEYLRVVNELVQVDAEIKAQGAQR
jgi:hypothetical protein